MPESGADSELLVSIQDRENGTDAENPNSSENTELINEGMEPEL